MQTDRLELGKKSAYINQYKPDLLYPIARKLKRNEIGIDEKNLPFCGQDIWNSYEVSWLNSKGKPIVKLARFSFAADSKNIIESKSFKLYLNSFNNTKFSDEDKVIATLKEDLSRAAESDVKVELFGLMTTEPIVGLTGVCLDELDIECDEYMVNPNLLTTKSSHITETLYSDLLKSNCLVTNQPDWGSVYIHYQGPAIDQASLLRYIVSLREHNEFHEQCVERIFNDISRKCHPEKLCVEARYTRRGGLDINPIRASHAELLRPYQRLVRQ